ncbi:MAG: hypothetical protein HY299_14250 [Verrucomicrobia bacterium]|nr:hypothetical protein [Verrucomicrobiota bacterium]
MARINSIFLSAMVILFIATTSSNGEEKSLGPKRVAIGQVSTNDALSVKSDRKGKTVDMGQVLSALQQRLNVVFVQSKKFDIVEYRDVGRRVDDIDTQKESGVFDSKTLAKRGRLRAAEFIVETTIDHFLDSEVDQPFADGSKGYRRRLQLSGTLKIVNTETGSMMDASSINSETNDVIVLPAGQVIEKQRLEELFPALLNDFCDRVVQSTENSIYPMRIIDVEKKLVTINRNDKSGLKKDEILKVLGPPKVIKDEETGREIRRPGAALGEVRITELDPNYVQAEIIKETQEGAIVKNAFLKRP